MIFDFFHSGIKGILLYSAVLSSEKLFLPAPTEVERRPAARV